MKTAILWILASSKDPSKVSLAIKGLITILVSGMLYIGHPVDSQQFNDLFASFILLIQQGTAIAGTVMTLYGTVRKIVTTVQGTNPAINSAN